MEAKCSIAPDIIWNWVIEALATSEQTDTSTLIDLVRMAPAISGDLGKDAREVVSLKILESLFLHGNEAIDDAGSAQTAKISFDSSERCEIVLQQILHEIPEHMAKVEKEKWDVRPFLTHKSSSLAKCVLKKLKEAILESSHPLLESLKERSKLVIPNASENRSPVNDGNFDVQDTVAKDDLVFLNRRKDKGNFQEKELQEPDQHETVTNTERINDNQTYVAASKEAFMSSQCTLDQDLVNDGNFDVQDTVAKDDLVILNRRKDKGNFQEKELQEPDQHETVTNTERINDNQTYIAASKEAFMSSQCTLDQYLVNDGNFDVQDTLAKDDLVFLNTRKDKGKFQEKELQEPDQHETVTNTERINDNQTYVAASKGAFMSSQCTLDQDLVNDGNFDVQDTVAKDDLVFLNTRKDKGKFQEKVLQEPDRLETDTNTERIDDDQTYIAAQKEEFMSSQRTLDQDSLINLCMKCNKGGHLLVCNSDACPLQIHESCLGFVVTLDENGNFFCPFCAYSRAISKYQEAKRKASQARNDLQAFSSLIVKPRHNKSSNDTGGQNVTSAENLVLPETSRSCLNDDLLYKGVSGANQSMTEAEGNNVDKGCQSSAQAVKDPGPKYPSFSGNGGLNPIPESSTPKQKCKNKESDGSIESSFSRELRKRKAQYTPHVYPSLRRKIVPWTKSEEETLKEGVEKYPSGIYKGIPWKEILDFGHKVFQKGRTPIDLKDKWRNICKGSSRGK